MSKMLKVLRHEYTRHVLRKRFILALLSVPLWVIAMGGLGFLSIVVGTDRTPVGYVDQSGLLANLVPAAKDETDILLGSQTFTPFTDEAAARAALDAKKIQAFYVLPADYLQQRQARLVYMEEPTTSIQRDFRVLLQRNLLADEPKDIAKLVTKGPIVQIQATQEDRSLGAGEWYKIVLPIAAAILLLVSVFTSGGYLMQAVVEEKENRTMEILATSVSPGQIMAGKTIALILVGMTQIAVWGSFPLLAVIIASSLVTLPPDIIDWGNLALMFLMIVPTFVMIASLMAAIGATVTESSEAQQFSAFITLPVMLPLMLSTPIALNPGSPVAMILSYFPLTSALTILLRMAVTTVPDWQIYLAAGLQIVSAVGSLWLAGKVFRLGMLQYGRRMKLKEVWRGLRTARS